MTKKGIEIAERKGVKMLKKMMFLSFIAVASFACANQKIYIDSSELCTEHEKFRIHIGHNVWLETDTLHRDASGLYTFESSIQHSLGGEIKAEYQKTWKCPYCYQYWPIGTACQNKDCPSKYK